MVKISVRGSRRHISALVCFARGNFVTERLTIQDTINVADLLLITNWKKPHYDSLGPFSAAV